MSLEEAAEVECPFKKHRGETMGQVLADDPGYICWLAENLDLRGDLKAAVEAMLPVAQEAAEAEGDPAADCTSPDIPDEDIPW